MTARKLSRGERFLPWNADRALTLKWNEKRTAVVCLALTAACSFRLAGIDSQSTSDLGTPFPDDAGLPTDGGVSAMGDLAIGDLAMPPDLGPGSVAGCSSTVARVCADSHHSAHCSFDAASNTWKPTTDRTCPSDSTCGGGYCRPPTGATSCTRASDCTGGAQCTVFNVGGQTKTYCAAALGGGGIYAACSGNGFDPSCASGVCSSAQQCLVVCVNQNDCGGNNCVSVGNVNVEGAPPSVMTCTM